MAVVDLSKIGLFTSIRKKLKRDLTIYPDLPYKGGGFKTTLQNGIYQMRRRPGGAICVREAFYDPGPPADPDQIAAQEKFADAVLAWQGLTQEQKNQYNKKAYGKHMSGYNLFLRIEMLK
jgi:hypothetical protein